MSDNNTHTNNSLDETSIPEEALKLLNEADNLSELGDWIQSVDIYEKLEELFSDNLSVLLRIAKETINLKTYPENYDYGQYDISIRCLIKILENNPDNIEAIIYLGHAYYKKGQGKEAIKLYNKAIEIEPENIEALVFLGHAYNKNGQGKEAIKLYNKAIEIEKGNVDLHISIADELLKINKYNHALQFYQDAIKKEPENAQALFGIAQSYFKLEEKKEAKIYYNKALSIASSDIGLKRIYADKLSQNNEYEEAIKYYKEILDCDPSNTEIMSLVALNYLILKNKKEAINYYKLYLEKKQYDPESIYIVANALRSFDCKKEALEYYKKLLKFNPLEGYVLSQIAQLYYDLRLLNEALGYFNTILYESDDEYSRQIEIHNLLMCSDIELKLKNYQQALQYNKRALDKEPDNSEAMSQRIEILHQSNGDIEEAFYYVYKLLSMPHDPEDQMDKISSLLYDIKKYDEALLYINKLKHQPPIFLIERKGDILELLGRHLESIHTYDIIIEALLSKKEHHNEKEISSIYNKKGVALINSGLYEDALICFDQALNLDNTNPEFYYNKGRAYDLLEQYTEALGCYEKAISRDPNNCNYILNKGKAHEKLNEDEDAQAEYEIVLKRSPNNVDALDFMGFLLLKKEEVDKAKAYFNRALKIDPQSNGAWLGKGQIEGMKQIEERNQVYLKKLKAIQLATIDGVTEIISENKNQMKKLTEYFEKNKERVDKLLIIEFGLGIGLLFIAIFYNIYSQEIVLSGILATFGGFSTIYGMISASPLKIQKNQVDYSQWMMAYYNWLQILYSNTQLLTKKAFNDEPLDWPELKELQDSQMSVTMDTILAIEKLCEFKKDEWLLSKTENNDSK